MTSKKPVLKPATEGSSSLTAPQPAADAQGAALDAVSQNEGARAALRSLALDVRSPKQEPEQNRVAEASTLGAKLLELTKTDGFRRGAKLAALGLTLVGAARPAMADTVLLQSQGASEVTTTARALASARGEDFVAVRPTTNALNAVFGAAERGDLELRHLIVHDDGTGSISLDQWRSLKARFPDAFDAVEHVHVIGPGVSARPFGGRSAELFPNARAVVGFDVSTTNEGNVASSWVLRETTRALGGVSGPRLSPQAALIKARTVANAGGSRGTTHATVDGQRHTALRVPRHLAVADATRVAVPIRRGVGIRQPNQETDVTTVQQRLRDLGFRIDVDGDYGPSTEKAINTFVALVEGKELVRHAAARVLPDSVVHRALESESVPRWMEIPARGPGFRNIDADAHDYTWSAVVDVIHSAGQRYQDDYLSRHPNASPILTNDASLRLGGFTPDHASHEVGLDLDVRLPTKSGNGAPTRVGYSSYDRDATKAQIKAFIADPNVERVLIGDPTLLADFRNSRDPNRAKVQDGGRGHRDHFHVDVVAPDLG